MRVQNKVLTLSLSKGEGGTGTSARVIVPDASFGKLAGVCLMASVTLSAAMTAAVGMAEVTLWSGAR
jgi:hypothetical protein